MANVPAFEKIPYSTVIRGESREMDVFKEDKTLRIF